MPNKSVKQLKEEEKQGLLTLADIQEDERKGVQQIVARIKKQEARREELENQWHEMSLLEEEKKAKGYSYIAGIDEAGRGPIAGPVTAACVRLPEGFTLYGLNDSKKLTEKDKDSFYNEIMKYADVGVGEASAEEIDEINIYQATKLAMKRAVENMEYAPDFLLVDAMSIPVKSDQEAYVKGDERSVSIAAASVIAKVTRDRFMKDLGESYPCYGFANNKGYGTKVHLDAIKAEGITPYHRKSFVPVRS
ncbi:ribonuclease HII [Salimicrobium halophilum]|uniref:Ribonuclease HII n=1 Tax=Salimicrobium halophilum TaxID=86666 RepID=A0A1G8QCU7_9BACI|nr:ribonuclease HII [Salimicrobium halophilum]SDJ02255.1 RNase HII [Salimicrobium halophilum]